MNKIHINEKLFYLCKIKQKYYLLPEEVTPLRVAKSKRFITKVMFLCAVARPRWDVGRNQWFDGKLGIWPFVEKVQAVRNSRNRVRGTWETKNVNVKRENFREMLVEKLLPSIIAKWPEADRARTIEIQQDNAKPHCFSDDEGFHDAVAAAGWDMRLVRQPPNSPDLNVLDLGYFAAIQSLQYKKRSKNIDDLINSVELSFIELDRYKLNNVFLTLQCVMEKIILNDGGNDFKLPHMNKAKLMRLNRLPISIQASEEVMTKIQAVPIQAVPIQAVPIQAAPIQAVPMQAAPIQAVPNQAVHI